MSAPEGPGALEEQRYTQPILDEIPPPTARSTQPWVLPTVAVAVMLSLLASVGLGLAQWRLATEARADRDALAAEVSLLREEVAALRLQVDGRAPEDGAPLLDPEQLLEDLFGGLLDGTRDGASSLAERLQEWFSGRGDTG
jgi:hypothetical protein